MVSSPTPYRSVALYCADNTSTKGQLCTGRPPKVDREAKFTQRKVTALGRELLDQSPYRLDLLLSDYFSFGCKVLLEQEEHPK
ncbi:hypothetical protein KIN20_024828 [Parelaphostrongylus tenuis]|uniref:Uncharacterized protein n=1 Tax=Parelaphostrongylus tenuis TaxID=148309 RepID=A0AAD5QWJ1_PARTN|nr:hypothetical protein KIN20_024828 [Parelaphostrongylus tenuis]